MSKLAYLKVSASLLLITIAPNLPIFVGIVAACSGGESGHCGG